MKRILLLLTVVSLLFIAAPALAAGNGTLEGNVVNRTDGGSSVADQEVTLKTYRNDNEVESAVATTDADGHFIFEGLDTDPSLSYEAQMVYQEADYYSGRLSFAKGQDSLTAELTVYDATDSDASIRVTTAHTVISVEEGNLRVKEYYYFENTSDRTYVGSEVATPDGKKATLAFFMPGGAVGLEPGGELMSCCIYGSDAGFIDTMPFLPGPKEAVYSYLVDYKSGAYTFNQRVRYPVADYNLLVMGEDVALSSDRLVTEEPVTLQDGLYQRLSGANLAPNDRITIELSGLPGGGSGTVLVIIMIVVLAGGAVFGLTVRRRKARPVVARADPARKEQELIVALARLDDSFAEGQIGEAEYRRRRAATKQQLTRLMRGR
ncbi:MAG TPA: hypothetical protein VJ377_04625 [Dehalococcoidales bacterium]|nr:MAG: hypothetical protein A2Z05_04760 [Chloroflexi bacterium RBG_16_60_22]HJX12795.1 hypothetical protein [Dehalococcoidales bacterium]